MASSSEVLDRKFRTESAKLKSRIYGIPMVTKGIEMVLEGLKDEFGIDPEDENFKDTPARVSRAYAEIFSGMAGTKDQVKGILSTAYKSDLNEMVIVGPVNVFSFCPHHLLPVEMIIHVAYVPKGKVLGLSKLARLSQILGARPALQEDTTRDIADALMLGLKPKGAACSIKGRHFCMAMRGAKADVAWTVTNSMEGVFLEKQNGARAEFLSHINSRSR